MKILWLFNMIIPQVALELGIPAESGGGWLSELAEEMEKQANIELAICAPCPKREKIQWRSALFYGFQTPRGLIKYDKEVELRLNQVLEDFQPDIVHIFGTEFPHTLAMIHAFHNPDRTVLHIQGLASVIARHYCSGLPYRVQKRHTFRDFIKRDSIIEQRNKMKKRGDYELEAIRSVYHVLGRTDWDKACTKQINSKLSYHYGGEMLRKSFYTNKWDYSSCVKHSILISQASYPVKGFHYMLEALPLLLDKFPDIRVYVAGGTDLNENSFTRQLKMSSYELYLRSLIKKYRLKDYIVYTGRLNEEGMCKQLLSSHVFVCPSSIENSPNSLAEAMILGVPVVASDVGGIKNMLVHKEEGYIYQHDAPYMLAYYIQRIFEQKEKIDKMSLAAREHAKKNHDKGRIINGLMECYFKMKEKI